MSTETVVSVPHIVSGREQSPALDVLAFVSDHLRHVGGLCLSYGIKQISYVRNSWESSNLCDKITRIALSPFVGLLACAWLLSGTASTLFSYAVRIPLTAAEHQNYVKLFRLTQRSGDFSPPDRNAVQILSLNIMGIPGFGCTLNDMPPCDDRVDGIARLIAEENPDIVLLQEAFMDVYAQRIFSRISPEYRYMVHQAEGGRFNALMGGSGLVVISKYPIEDIAVRQYQYKDHLEGERLQTKSAVAATISCNGRQICVGTTHLQSAGAMQPFSVRNELKEALQTVDELAQKTNDVAVKLLIGDMNFDSVEGIYREADSHNSTHILIHRDETGECRLLDVNGSVPSGWSVVEFLRAEPYAGVLQSDGSWLPSRSLALEQEAFHRWNPVFPTTQNFDSTSTWIITQPPAERGCDASSQIWIIPKEMRPDREVLIEQRHYGLYANASLRSIQLTGQYMLDWCFRSKPAADGTIRVETEIVGTGADQKSWLDTVSDHKALRCTITGL